MLISAISIAISVTALTFSIFAWQLSRLKDKRDLYLQLHERLIASDLRRGRSDLADRACTPEGAESLVGDRKSDDYERVCRALSMLDLAALYVEQRYINRKMFEREWGDIYASLRENAVEFIAARKQGDPQYSIWEWEHFMTLANRIHDQSRIGAVSAQGNSLPST